MLNQVSVYEYKPGLYKVCITPDRGKKSPFLDDVPSSDRLSQSLARTKKTVKELALCNDWDYFCTFTFSDDRSDYDLCLKKLTTFFENYKKRYSKDFKYLVIPEFHRDKQNFHFHGLVKGVYDLVVPDMVLKRLSSGDLIDVPNSKKYFRWNAYRLGFFNASVVRDSDRVRSYICKYITKDLCAMTDFKGRQLVLHSKGLKRPEKLYTRLQEVNFEGLEACNNKRFVSDYRVVYDNLSLKEIDYIFSILRKEEN